MRTKQVYPGINNIMKVTSKMRTKQLYPGINNGQKIRVILNGVGIYTTVNQAQGMFMNIDHRVIVDYALCELSRERHITGISSRRNGIDFQVDLL